MSRKATIGLICLVALGYLLAVVLQVAGIHVIVPTLIAGYLLGLHLRDQYARRSY